MLNLFGEEVVEAAPKPEKSKGQAETSPLFDSAAFAQLKGQMALTEKEEA